MWGLGRDMDISVWCSQDEHMCRLNFTRGWELRVGRAGCELIAAEQLEMGGAGVNLVGAGPHLLRIGHSHGTTRMAR